ncbi:MAG: ABC transporter ATP-binding protein [Candidimonas sp.]|nr:MAG: ABC transporter ATP-binding protein [Candidimonas sp.]
MNAALELDHVSAFYGTSQILHAISMRAPAGRVTCLLGLNGMGKTTTLRTIMGLVSRVDGAIRVDGRDLAGHTYARARLGVTLVPEDRKVFASLTVLENMQVSERSGAGGQRFHIDEAIALFEKLGQRLDQRAGTLSGGEQQMLVVARALLANPSYILLDEPTEGLAPEYVDAIQKSVQVAREHGIGIVLVEQSLRLALAVGDFFYVIENGQMVFAESREGVAASPGVLENLLTAAVR